ncbi:pickpocket protein 11-like [Episyrphus balteatus]|uniref:pickpocket protein 11-like n=1 Tax=Episyrphus balteatus TaxID=286459 RepID=UPI0024857972|nr:pickpocket protein 11-like [Episyrphus balteatus]
MAIESNESPIYLVNFENYLKPKKKSILIEEKTPNHEDLFEKKTTFELFCDLSSIHGISMLYLNKSASLCERILWRIIIFTAIIITIVVLYYWTAINHETPTVTLIETTSYPGFVVPFPAITLCSLNRISRRRAIKLAEKFVLKSNLTKEKILELFEVPLYINEKVHASEQDFQMFDDLMTANNSSLLELFYYTNPDCMEELKKCKWRGRAVQCSSIFEPVVVLRGRCCAFNYFAREDNQTKRYNKFLIPSPAPRQVYGCGYDTGLTVLIDPQADDYLAGALKYPGYRVIVADAYDFPEDNGNNELFSVKQEAYVGVKTTLIFGTSYLENMPLWKRGCIFDKEYKLKYFRQYSYWNCLAECFSARLWRKCGCVTHNMIQPVGAPMCGLKKFQCVLKENAIFQQLVEDADILGKKVCNCMAECSYFKYRTVVAAGGLNRTFVKGNHRFFKNITTTNEILLHVYFSGLTTAKYRIDAIESWQSIVGTVGGIAGMTMGINVVCIAEVFFFLCIRPIYMKYVKAKQDTSYNIN